MSEATDNPAYLFAALAAGSAFKALAGYWISRNGDSNSGEYQLVGRVAQLYCHPIKSFRALQIEEGICTPLGISAYGVTDRHWVVGRADGLYVSQREEPSMVLIQVQVKGDVMQLDAPRMDPITIPVNPPVTEDKLSKLSTKYDTVPSLDCGDEVAEWLCRYFNRKGLRLHYSAPSLQKRKSTNVVKPWTRGARPGDLMAFTDTCNYNVLSSSSVAALNQRLENPVTIRNFRTNIVVDGCDAFAEDNWVSLRIGDVQLRAVDQCARCLLVTVDQQTGVKDAKQEPITTLRKFRRKEPYGVLPLFGVNFNLERGGKVRVGDPIYAKIGQIKVSRK